MIVEYRVLGPLEVLADGVPVPVPAGRGRVLLATLLLRANEFVTVDELIDRVWDGEPPAPDRAHKTLQMTVSRLRQALGDANCVQTSSRGYSALIRPDQLDLTRFRALTAQGEHRAALELWLGPVLANVASESLQRDDVPRLLEEQVVALERRIDQDLARDTDVLVPELRALVQRYPLRETFWAQLMLALHRSNQQVEALAVYREVRDRLVEELGVDPGPRLRAAHEQVLSGKVPATSVPRELSAVSVPRQLPVGVPHFVGREDELAHLTGLLDARSGAPVLISAINGIGGVGKTALALRWAHQIADQFPDGQLYINLRGFDTRAEPLDPHTVARDFLLALGVPAKDVPASEEALIAAYRSALAGLRVMLVLDNAKGVEQVRPLLPGGAGCLVLVTSRNQLSGLVVREGAQPVALDVLGRQAAIDLLSERVGAARVAAEHDAVSRLVERCAGLPLALSIVAARAVYGHSLAALADELDRERLDALDIDDPATGIRSVFSWSLRFVSEAAARVFVLLGLHPGPDFTVAAVASLAALPLTEARRALTELVAGSLAGTAANGRFVLHDLLRDYARERADLLSEQIRTDAVRRLYDHYVHSSLAAWRTMSYPTRDLAGESPVRDVVLVEASDLDQANEWFASERLVLMAVVTQAEMSGADDVVWRLAMLMHMFLLRSGHVGEAEVFDTRGLAAARREGDAWGEARLSRFLAATLIALRKLPDAERHIRFALSYEREFGHVRDESILLRGLAFVHELEGRAQDALDVLQEIQPRAAGLQGDPEEANYLSALGTAHHRLGEHARALEVCLRAVALFAEFPDQMPMEAKATVHETLGDIYLELGRLTDAIDGYGEAVRLLRQMRAMKDLAVALVKLARACITADDEASARNHLVEAETIYEQLGEPAAAEARKLLASLD